MNRADQPARRSAPRRSRPNASLRLCASSSTSPSCARRSVPRRSTNEARSSSLERARAPARRCMRSWVPQRVIRVPLFRSTITSARVVHPAHRATAVTWGLPRASLLPLHPPTFAEGVGSLKRVGACCRSARRHRSTCKDAIGDPEVHGAREDARAADALARVALDRVARADPETGAPFGRSRMSCREASAARSIDADIEQRAC